MYVYVCVCAIFMYNIFVCMFMYLNRGCYEGAHTTQYEQETLYHHLRSLLMLKSVSFTSTVGYLSRETSCLSSFSSMSRVRSLIYIYKPFSRTLRHLSSRSFFSNGSSLLLFDLQADGRQARESESNFLFGFLFVALQSDRKKVEKALLCYF